MILKIWMASLIGPETISLSTRYPTIVTKRVQLVLAMCSSEWRLFSDPADKAASFGNVFPCYGC